MRKTLMSDNTRFKIYMTKFDVLRKLDSGDIVYISCEFVVGIAVNFFGGNFNTYTIVPTESLLVLIDRSKSPLRNKWGEGRQDSLPSGL